MKSILRKVLILLINTVIMFINFSDTKLGYDIIIVGAGPTGCIAAKNLSDSYNVLLLDQSYLPRNKACGGILVMDAKNIVDGLDPPSDIFSNPKKLDIHYADWDSNVEKTVVKEFYNVNRKKFDEWLLNNADKKNVSILPKTKLVDFKFTKDKDYVVAVVSSNGNVKTVVCRYLVGCDGALSTVRKNLTKNRPPYYIAVQEFAKGFNAKKAYFIFDNEITDFYSWIIPKKKGALIGSALLPKDSQEKFAILKKKIMKKVGAKKIKGEVTSALLSRPDSIKEIFLGEKNVLLGGEAAGLISPSSGEGISFALKSGLLCANCINSSKNPLKLYKEQCHGMIKRLTNKIKKSNKIKEKSKRLDLMQK